MENYAVVSFMGLAPYWFEMDNSLMVNEEGDVNLLAKLSTSGSSHKHRTYNLALSLQPT